ncbi:MAG TPA: pyridoxamine 5'-phosphate oxidase family protein [Pyrinomonadaceae bacterium]|nr:pyridoxamine 5'-phosphate oxidase family protein [Pyrinomonadaceae bacterium]
MSTALVPTNDLQKLRDMVKDIDFCMLTTIDERGDLHSRPMSSNGDIDDNADLWFFTAVSSHKVSEINDTPRVNVSFADPQNQNYISITGRAHLVRDRKKIDELWRETFKMWFPKGKDDPNVALLRVNAEKAEYWDSPSSTISFALNFVHTLVTGEQSDSGEHKQLQF